MFTRLLVFVLLIAVPILNLAQVDLTKGLVAYYPFNGNSNDVSGNNNNPSFNNATLTSDYFGRPNSAYHFNGVDNYMQISNSSSLNISNQISLCAWVKPTGFYTGQCYNNMIISKENVDYQTGNFSLRYADVVNGCTNHPDIANEHFVGNDEVSNVDSAPIQLNKWYSVVYTSDGVRSKLFINCKLVADVPVTNTSYSNPYDLFLGHLDNTTYPYWLNADLDEVRIYNRPLNADEVSAYSFSCAEKSPCNSWAKITQNVSGIQVGDLDVTGNQITVEATFNRTAPYTGSQLFAGDLVSKHSAPKDANYLLRPNTAEITTTNGYFKTPDICDVKLNKTYHVAMVYDGSNLKFYRDGFLMSSIACSGNLYQNDFITAIGTFAENPNQTNENLIGYVNEVRIWNVARTQNQIKTYMNQSLPNPTAQQGLLAYYTFNDLQNKQGNPQWNASVVGNATINQTNPQCNFTADSCTAVISPNVTASFTAPDLVCVNSPVKLTNTSKNASSYYWSFCQADIKQSPTGQNLGNISSGFSLPVYSDIVQQNGNYYVFLVNNYPGSLMRLDFGNSLLNTPSAVKLGNFGGTLENNAEGLQIVNTGNHWYGILVGGSAAGGTTPQILKIDFGNDITNPSPTATNWGDIGNMAYPHEITIIQESGTWYGFVANTQNNTITEFNFGTDFTNPPTSKNLGSFNLLDGPVGLSLIKNNSNWYLFVTCSYNNTIVRLDFGNSILNTPVANSLGNPDQSLHLCYDINIHNDCSGVYGFVINSDDNYNNIIRLDFNNDLLSIPTATPLGNIGNLSAPQSLSTLFRVGNDLYNFIPNAHNNTLTRLKFSGCNNSSIPNTSQANPSSIKYDSVGVYNINLTVDEGLPSQTSFCKQIVVKDCKNSCDSFFINAGNDTAICYGSSIQLKATGATTYKWITSSALSDTTIANPVAKPLTTTLFIVTGSNAAGCSKTDTIKVTVLPLPVFSINNDTSVCNGSKINLLASGKSNYQYKWTPSTYLSNVSIANPVASPTDTIKYFVTATDSNKCVSKDSVQINVVPVPVVTTINDTSICLKDTAVLLTSAVNATKFVWNPSSGLNNTSTQNPKASPVSTTNYIVTASNSLCSSKDSVRITILALPKVFAGNDTTTCGTGTAQLHASGAISYSWSPATGLSNLNIPNPVASPASTTTYTVTGTGTNTCKNVDSVTVFKEPNPVFTVMPIDSSICSGQKITLTAAGGDTYNWSPALTLSTTTAAVTIASPISATKYSVFIYDSTCKVSQTLSSTISIKSKPTITVTKSNDVDCANPQAQLTASGGVNYMWAPDSAISSTTISNPVVNPTTDTWYSVISTGSNGCAAQDSILVKSTLGNQGMYVPNAFTPNGDGRNDCFGVHYWGQATSFDMKVFDKWGMMVYHSQNVGECWDGTIKGKKQGSGVYVYMIKAASACGKQDIFRKGTVVLIR